MDSRLNKERNKVIKWIYRNKKKLIFTSIAFGTIVLTIFYAKNKDEIDIIFEELKNKINGNKNLGLNKSSNDYEIKPLNDLITIENVNEECCEIVEKIPCNVSEHIRNLPLNMKPSLNKLKEAEERGIILGENQTFVDSYIKNKTVA